MCKELQQSVQYRTTPWSDCPQAAARAAVGWATIRFTSQKQLLTSSLSIATHWHAGARQARAGCDQRDFAVLEPSSVAARDENQDRPYRRRMEVYAFLIVTVVLMPALAVATVGTWGLTVWIYQAINGPPGPPAPPPK